MDERPDLLLKAGLAFAFIILGLAAIVIMVGLYRNQLEVTGTAGVLIGAATPIIVGIVLKKSNGSGDKK